MGLMVYSLDNIPETNNRDYFIYLLDYGWKGSISQILDNNFELMAQKSANNRAVIIKGFGSHFDNEVFSWHNINGINGEDVLPALLITNRHPMDFRHSWEFSGKETDLYRENEETNMKLILIPFRNFCKTDMDVIELIQKVFKNIEEQKDISEFEISQKIKNNKSKQDQLLDTIVLQPNFGGVGVDLKMLIKKFFSN